MTRFEKVKPGIEFLHGEEPILSLESAVDIASDYLDCEFCPCWKQCYAIHNGFKANGKACKETLRAYLSEEVEFDLEEDIVNEIKRIYKTEYTPVMSELLRNYTDQLTVAQIEELLEWSGDDEYMVVTADKEIITKEEANERT